MQPSAFLCNIYLLLLLLRLLPSCPSSCILLLLLTGKWSWVNLPNFFQFSSEDIELGNFLKRRPLTEHTAGNIDDRHCSRVQG